MLQICWVSKGFPSVRNTNTKSTHNIFQIIDSDWEQMVSWNSWLQILVIFSVPLDECWNGNFKHFTTTTSLQHSLKYTARNITLIGYSYRNWHGAIKETLQVILSKKASFFSKTVNAYFTAVPLRTPSTHHSFNILAGTQNSQNEVTMVFLSRSGRKLEKYPETDHGRRLFLILSTPRYEWFANCLETSGWLKCKCSLRM